MTEPVDDVEEPPARRRWIPIAVVAVLLAAGLGIGLGVGLSGSSSPSGPEGVALQNGPDLAPPNTTADRKTIDGITCRPTMDQTEEAYHIHVHVNVFVNGVQERIPAGAGIRGPLEPTQYPGGTMYDNSPSGCLYWLHTHADDGVIHIEAPQKGSFTLGQFFDIWGQPLGPDRVGPAQGPVVAFVDGNRVGNPHDIPLVDKEVVQLDVGSPVVPYKPLKFTVTGGECSSSCGGVPTTG